MTLTPGEIHALIVGWSLVGCACVYGLWVCGSILFEHYSQLYRGYRQERSGQPSQDPCETNNSASGNIGQRSYFSTENGGASRLSFQWLNAIFQFFFNLVAKCVNVLPKSFFIHHRNAMESDATTLAPSTPKTIRADYKQNK
jgi:hypothetical protein